MHISLHTCFFLTNYFTSSVIFPYVGLLAYINQSSTNGLNFVFSMSHNAGVKIQCTFALAAFPYPNCSCPLPSGRSKISSLPSQADGSRALPSAVPSRDPYCCHVHKHKETKPVHFQWPGNFLLSMRIWSKTMLNTQQDTSLSSHRPFPGLGRFLLLGRKIFKNAESPKLEEVNSTETKGSYKSTSPCNKE